MDNGTQKETRCCLWRASGGPWGRDSLVEMNASTINSRFFFVQKQMNDCIKKKNTYFSLMWTLLK